MTDSERENDATLTVSEDGAAAGDARNERELNPEIVKLLRRILKSLLGIFGKPKEL